MAYTSVTGVPPPQRNDDAQSLLYKIAWALWGVINGDFGFLVRGTVTPGANTSTVAATLTSFSKTVAATSTPEVLIGVSTLCEAVVISPLRSNTGTAYVGFVGTDDLQTLVTPCVIDAPPGKKIDLSLIWCDVTVNGEGVRVGYIN